MRNDIVLLADNLPGGAECVCSLIYQDSDRPYTIIGFLERLLTVLWEIRFELH